MHINLKIKLALFFLFLIISFSNAQQAQRTCGFDSIREELLKNPEYLEQEIQFENKVREYITENKIIQSRLNAPQAMQTILTIPLVVHVFHKGEAVGTGTNISVTRIQSSINHLNQVYRGQTAGNSVDFGIEFVLAKRDPDCNPTNGIVRINGSTIPGYNANGIQFPGTTGPGVNQSTLLNYSTWPAAEYLNIWVVSKITGANVVGYAYQHRTNSNTPGTVILHDNVGYDLGNPVLAFNGDNSTVIHEVGHFMRLLHTFQGDNNGSSCPVNNNPFVDGDQCADTVPHKRSGGSCPGNNNCTGTAWLDNNTKKNYMSYYLCIDRLTNDQKNRSRASLEGSELVNSRGGTPPSTSYI